MKRGTFKKLTYSEKLAKIASKPRVTGLKRSKGAKQPVKRKEKSLAKYKKELDAVFSKFIRQRDQGQCFTCPNKNDPKKMQCGHFVPRQYLAVRYDERNCNCQCYACNMLYGGQGATYAIRLKQKYGQETVEWLEAQRWVTTKLDIPWYQEQIKKYTSMLQLPI